MSCVEFIPEPNIPTALEAECFVLGMELERALRELAPLLARLEAVQSQVDAVVRADGARWRPVLAVHEADERVDNICQTVGLDRLWRLCEDVGLHVSC